MLVIDRLVGNNKKIDRELRAGTNGKMIFKNQS